MSKFHVNPESGQVGECRATKQCRFGDSAHHYDSEAAARAAYEGFMTDSTFVAHSAPQAAVPLSDLMDLELLRRDIEAGYIASRPHDDDPELQILCYTKNTQFAGHWNDATKVARGLVIRNPGDDLHDATVVERPWRKFFTLEQVDTGWALGDEEADSTTFREVDNIDFDAPAEVTDKADGSMGILYRHPDGLPAFATKGSFGSDQAHYYTAMLRRDPQLLEDAEALLADTGTTHLFELTGPRNQIVLDYTEDGITMLGSVDKASGLYHSANDYEGRWSGGIVETFQANNLTEALAIPDRPNREGLVIRTISEDPEKQLQIKVKQEDYKYLHRIISSFSVKDARAALRESPATMGDLLNAAKTGRLEDIQGLAPLLSSPIQNEAVAKALSTRRKLIGEATFPRLAILAEANERVNALPDSSLADPKAFAQSIASEDPRMKADLFSFFNARRKGDDVETQRGSFILRNISQGLSAAAFGEDEEA